MAENDKNFLWTVKLDWLYIISKLNLNNINQIPEFKKAKAIRRLTRIYGSEKLMDFEPEYLENLVVNELKEILKKELSLNARKQREMEQKVREKVMPFKNGRIINIDPRELPEEVRKYFKRFMGDDDEEDKDEDKYKEDRKSYYI
ncbi:MAG: hypothetical protein ACXAEX_04325 [Promethearchaeota archaeon]|jgi:hypothetical protein